MTCFNSGVHNKLTELRVVFNSTGHIAIVNIKMFQIGECINTQNGSFNTAVHIFILMILCPLLTTAKTCFLTVGNHCNNLCVFKLNASHIKHTQSAYCGIGSGKVVVCTGRNSLKVNKKEQCYHKQSCENMEIVAVIYKEIAERTHINEIGNYGDNCN